MFSVLAALLLIFIIWLVNRDSPEDELVEFFKEFGTTVGAEENTFYWKVTQKFLKTKGELASVIQRKVSGDLSSVEIGEIEKEEVAILGKLRWLVSFAEKYQPVVTQKLIDELSLSDLINDERLAGYQMPQKRLRKKIA